MNIKENFLNPAIFIILIAITMFILSGCKNDDDTCPETTWYQDFDNDGLGNPDISITDCVQPLGYVNNNDDDNDTLDPSTQLVFKDINSVYIGETYPLTIYLPRGYETKNLPVLYLLEGKTYYQDLITWSSDIDVEAIIVGIGDNLFEENFDKIARDYIPTSGTTAGHLNFYNFLIEEVVPYIDANYENDHEARTLIGFNPSGLFTNFSLLNKAPEDQFFKGFLSVDPQDRSRDIITDMVENLSYSGDAKNIKIHISQVSGTSRADWFNNLLLAQEFPWLDIDFYTFEAEDSEGIKPPVLEPSMKKGLQFIYK
ncbi:alpha/beta hydrolase-fold protein [Algoriphagus sp. SE2]|uniref:alpha/beta hydrolase-fold protein n=1 Tax=Algoriphagus sp. SE2 TaxID=3141536 RepID=UPI0031CD96C9